MWESRVAPLSGVFFALLLVAGFIVDPNTDYMPPEAEVLAHVQAGPLRVMTGAYLALLAAGALLWFSGSSYRSLRRLDDDEGRLSVIALGGGIFASALVAVGAVSMIAIAERVRIVGATDPGVAAALFDIRSVALGNAAPFGLAVLIGAWGIASLRAKTHKPWIGWISLVIALGLISPFGYILLAAALAWVAVAGIWVYRSAVARTPAGVG